MINIIRLTREAESGWIQHPHVRKCGPCFAGVLEVRNIRCVRHFIEAARYVLADRAERSGKHKERENERANMPTTSGKA